MLAESRGVPSVNAYLNLCSTLGLLSCRMSTTYVSMELGRAYDRTYCPAISMRADNQGGLSIRRTNLKSISPQLFERSSFRTAY